MVTMKLPEENPRDVGAGKIERDFSIDNWNGRKGIKTWGYQEDRK